MLIWIVIILGIAALAVGIAKRGAGRDRYRGITGDLDRMTREDLANATAEVLSGIQGLLQQAGGDGVKILQALRPTDYGRGVREIWDRKAATAGIPGDPLSARIYQLDKWEWVPTPPDDEEIYQATVALQGVIGSTALPLSVSHWSTFELQQTGIGDICNLTDQTNLEDIAETCDRLYRYLWNMSHYPTGADFGPWLRLGWAYLYWFLPAQYRVRLW